MESEHWHRLQELFAAANRLAKERRAAYLDRECRGEPELRAEVERLLEHAATEPGVVENAIRAALNQAPSSSPPRDWRVGPYRLVRELGRGGMGEVFLAERDDGQFQQRVAVKLVAGGASNPRIVERFRAERQILARLDHPFIARLLDGGSTAAGVPYFVLEHVEGERIDRYCDRKRLGIPERLELFRRVCSAVSVAHRNLIVHRDLKPSNILVTDAGAPKLLDFGIAKLLEPEEGRRDATVTELGTRLMTPEYASPEQVRGEAVSTATDVHALGLLLFELLTGRRAQCIESSRPEDIERVVCETPSALPSAVVHQESDEGSAEELSRARGSVPSKLERILAGDLDRIVLEARHKDPERRYGSVAELSEDVQRYLQGKPVLAHSDSAAYRARKFLRRHRVGTAAVAVVALSFTGGVLGTTMQARRATREARRAEEVTEFLVDLLEHSDPETARGRAVTVREVLDRASVRVRTELSSQPRMQATLQNLLARLYLPLGEIAEGLEQAREALERRTALLGERHAEVAETRALLAELLVAEGSYEQAEVEARTALDMRLDDLADDDPAVARSLGVLGEVLEKQGRFGEARDAFEGAARIQRRRFGDEDATLAQTLYKWAFVELQDGNLESARAYYSESLRISREIAKGPSLDAATSLAGLAFTLVSLGRTQDGAEMMRESVDITRELLGDDHPELGFRLNGLAIVRSELGDPEGAEAAYLDALRIFETSLGPAHPEVATVLNNLGTLRHREERYVEAAEFYGRAVELRRRALGADHPLVGSTLSYQAFSLHRAGSPEAEALYRESLEQLLGSRGADHPGVANVYNDLGRLLIDTEQFEEAEPMLRESIEIRERVYGGDDRRTWTSKMNLGAALTGLGALDSGERLLRDASDWRTEHEGRESPGAIDADLLLSECLFHLGRAEEARVLLQDARARIDPAKGAEYWLSRLARRVERRNADPGDSEESERDESGRARLGDDVGRTALDGYRSP